MTGTTMIHVSKPDGMNRDKDITVVVHDNGGSWHTVTRKDYQVPLLEIVMALGVDSRRRGREIIVAGGVKFDNYHNNPYRDPNEKFDLYMDGEFEVWIGKEWWKKKKMKDLVIPDIERWAVVHTYPVWVDNDLKRIIDTYVPADVLQTDYRRPQ